jgi:hypothetical protein
MSGEDRVASANPIRILLGMTLTIGGAAALVFFTFVSYGRGQFLDGWSITLGLAGLPLLSAFAQIAALIGMALVWRAMGRNAPHFRSSRRTPGPR